MTPPTQALSPRSRPPTRPTRAGANCVLDDLKRFGPSEMLEDRVGSPQLLTLAASLEYCRVLASKHYENFSVASRLLPKNLRQDFANLYAYCRWSDDLADETGDPSLAMSLLDWWEGELRDCFGGKAQHPVYLALMQTIEKHSLEITPFLDLLRAFRSDQTKTRYASDEELEVYCSGSANPVGRILLKMARCDSPRNVAWSDSICTGLQIANFCQDIAVDASRNRIYLPKSRWMVENVDESDFLQGERTEPLQRLVSRWAQVARSKLIDGFPLCNGVPLWLARDLQLFIRGGLALLEQMAKVDYDVWSHPIEVSKRRKLTLLARAMFAPRSTVYRFVSPSNLDSNAPQTRNQIG